MDEFKPKPCRFRYKKGSKVYEGAVNVAPSTLQAARRGNTPSLSAIERDVTHVLRTQDEKFLSTAKWCKIKWIDQTDYSSNGPRKELI